MIDKEIIIDGIDVTRCEFCEWKDSNIPQCRVRLTSFEPTCEGYNCYFKQHARVKEAKEEECEKLKQELQEVKEDLNESNFDRNIAQLEAYQYKQALDEIERFFDKRCDICREQDGIEVICDFCWKKDIKDIINKGKKVSNGISSIKQSKT